MLDKKDRDNHAAGAEDPEDKGIQFLLIVDEKVADGDSSHP